MHIYRLSGNRSCSKIGSLSNVHTLYNTMLWGILELGTDVRKIRLNTYLGLQGDINMTTVFGRDVIVTDNLIVDNMEKRGLYQKGKICNLCSFPTECRYIILPCVVLHTHILTMPTYCFITSQYYLCFLSWCINDLYELGYDKSVSSA